MILGVTWISSLYMMTDATPWMSYLDVILYRRSWHNLDAYTIFYVFSPSSLSLNCSKSRQSNGKSLLYVKGWILSVLWKWEFNNCIRPLDSVTTSSTHSVYLVLCFSLSTAGMEGLISSVRCKFFFIFVTFKGMKRLIHDG